VRTRRPIPPASCEDRLEADLRVYQQVDETGKPIGEAARLVGFCRRFLEDCPSTHAEDVVRDAIGSVFGDLRCSYDGDSARLRRYLYERTKLRALSHARTCGASSRRTVTLTDDDEIDALDPRSSPELVVLEQVERGLWRQATNQLTIRQQEVVVGYLSGLSTGEMADVLTIKPASVRARFRRAIPVLRTALRALGSDNSEVYHG